MLPSWPGPGSTISTGFTGTKRLPARDGCHARRPRMVICIGVYCKNSAPPDVAGSSWCCEAPRKQRGQSVDPAVEEFSQIAMITAENSGLAIGIPRCSLAQGGPCFIRPKAATLSLESQGHPRVGGVDRVADQRCGQGPNHGGQDGLEAGRADGADAAKSQAIFCGAKLRSCNTSVATGLDRGRTLPLAGPCGA